MTPQYEDHCQARKRYLNPAINADVIHSISQRYALTALKADGKGEHDSYASAYRAFRDVASESGEYHTMEAMDIDASIYGYYIEEKALT